MRHMTRKSSLLATLVLSSLPSGLQAAGNGDNRLEVPNEYPSINKAIWEAGEGDVVVVHPGEYTEDLFIDKDVTIEGLRVNGERPVVYNDRCIHQVRSYGKHHVTARISNMTFTRGNSHFSPRRTGFTVETASVEFDNCAFEFLLYETSADDHTWSQTAQGGAVRINKGNGSFNRCTFMGNTATRLGQFTTARGGAIAITQGQLDIQDSDFTSNQALAPVTWNDIDEIASGYAMGGAIWSHGTDVTLFNTTFMGNIARALLAQDSPEGEYAVSGAFGGSLYLGSSRTIDIVKCTFSANGVGGNMPYDRFLHGGAIYAAGSKNSPMVVDSCTFSHNLADRAGAILSSGHKLILESDDFICNEFDHVLSDLLSESHCRWWDCQEEDPCLYDVNGDGVVDQRDYDQAFIAYYRNRHDGPEDVNGDGRVDRDDLNLIRDNFGECR